MTQSERPNPDDILSLINSEAKEQKRNRGYLKIFLGYVAGIGKTYRMLSEAKSLVGKGHKVLIGIVETHGRTETENLLSGLELLPRRQITYANIQLEEFDIDAVLQIKPEYILVDELAHTNVPGSRHEKRFQDVEELLNAGINVYTTLNVQHIESCKDIVKQITQIEIKETVPDYVLECADKIEVVDLPTEELLQRLKEGKIYIPEKAERAATEFFREGNLLALRELAFRCATKYVDEDMTEYLQKHGVVGPWDASSKIMVCISSSPTSEKLIRVAHRFASSLNSEWFAVSVDSVKNLEFGNNTNVGLEKNIRLSEQLGARIMRLQGYSVAQEIISFAKKHNITLIVLGYSKRSWIEEFLRGSVVDRIVRNSSPAQVLLVEGEKNTNRIQKNNIAESVENPLQENGYKDYIVSILSILITTLICFPFRDITEIANIPMFFLIPIVISSILSGFRGGLLSSLLAVASFDFIFVPPYYSFSVHDFRFIPTFLILFSVGITTSFLSEVFHRQVLKVKKNENFISYLYDFSRDLLASKKLQDILDKSVKSFSQTFECDAVILLPTDDSSVLVIKSINGIQENFAEKDLGVAIWVFNNKQSAGKHTQTLASSRWYFIPLVSENKSLGVLALAAKSELSQENKRLIDSFASIISLAIAYVGLEK